MPEPGPVSARRGPGAYLVVVLLALVGGLALLVARSQALPDEPSPVDWERAVCAHCGMHVGDPRFAAQIIATDHRVHHFDDPGCLFEWQADHPEVEAHAVWFHDLSADRWYRASEVAFAMVEETPMGFGIGAVAAGTPGALDADAARAHVLSGTPEGH